MARRRWLELFRGVVVGELPLDARVVRRAALDGDLLLVLADGQTVLAAAVLDVVALSTTTTTTTTTTITTLRRRGWHLIAW